MCVCLLGFIVGASPLFENMCVHSLGYIVGASHTIPQGFSSLLLKPYIKGVTHFQEVGWWRTWMVECVTLFYASATKHLGIGMSVGLLVGRFRHNFKKVLCASP